MAPRHSDWQPLQQVRTLTLGGGLAGKRIYVPETKQVEIFGGAKRCDPEVHEFVWASARASWLRDIATGISSYQRPLSRVKFLQELRHLVVQASSGSTGNTDDKMADLEMSDSDLS